MPKRSEKRESAKAEYIARRAKGEKVNLRELAEQQGVSYQSVRNWKKADSWDDQIPKRKRGGQPGNRNSQGKKNARGHHDGAPAGNKNAEKDGAYSTVFFDMLSDPEKELAAATPTDSKEALINELQILKVREHRILEKIAFYENSKQDKMFLNSLVDMRVPGGKGKAKRDGASQTMGMYNKDSAFERSLKLQEALYKVQGRIAAIVNSLRAMEEADRRIEIDKRKLEILEMRTTGSVDVNDPEEGDGEDTDMEIVE